MNIVYNSVFFLGTQFVRTSTISVQIKAVFFLFFFIYKSHVNVIGYGEMYIYYAGKHTGFHVPETVQGEVH